MEQKTRFVEIFGDIADGIFIESIMDCWPTYEQTKVEINQTRGIYGQKIQEVSVCPYVFYSIAVNSNGTVSLCFLDWSRKLVIGDCHKDKIKKIWQGQELRNFQMMFLKGERKSHPICGNCGQLRQGEPDDIDEYSELLFRKLAVRASS